MAIKTSTYIYGFVLTLIVSEAALAGSLTSKIGYQYSYNNNVMNAYNTEQQLADQQHSLTANISYAWQLT